MLRKLALATVIAIGFSNAVLASQNTPLVRDLSNLTWTKSPNSPSERSVLVGNPNKKGYYVTWVKVPANYVSKPHYHDLSEDSIVIAGKAKVTLVGKNGKQETVSISKGQFISMPAGQTHIIKTGNEGVILQNSGMGPMDSKFAS